MSVTNYYNNQSPTNSVGAKAALTQSLPKSNFNRIGPPPNAPPPRLVQQGNSVSMATTTTTTVGALSSSPVQLNNASVRKISAASPFPPKLTHKTSNITFNEPVKVTKKKAAKKAPLITSKSSSGVGIKRLLFKKKGNKKDTEPAVSTNNLKKDKSEQKFNVRPLSAEGDQASGSDSDTNSPMQVPVSCSVPTSTSTPSFAYQNVFDDEAFMNRNQHKFEDPHVDKKPMPLPKKNSLSNATIKSTVLKSGGRSQEMASLNATILKEEEVSTDNRDSGTDSPTSDIRREYQRDSDSPLCYIGSPPPTSSITSGVMAAEKQPASPSSVQSPQATSSPTRVLSPTSKGKGPRSVMSPEPKKQRRSTEAFLPVNYTGSGINLLSDLSKYPLFQSDPAVSSPGQSISSVMGSIKQEMVKTTSKSGLPGSVPMRRRSTPREVRRAVMSDGAQLDLDDGDDDYIPMNPIRVTTSMNFLEASLDANDPRASGYYLKILAPDGKTPTTAKDEEMEIVQSDECPSSPDSYDEVNLGPIVTAPVRESIKSPEDEYISISGQRPYSLSLLDGSEGASKDVAGVDRDHPLLQSPSKQTAEDRKKSDENNKIQISDNGGKGLKYSDVTITPVGSEGNAIKRKPSAPKKFSYQLVQLEQGRKSTLEDSETKQSPSSGHLPNKYGAGTQRRESELAVSSITTEEERKISLPAGIYSQRQPPVASKDTLSRLADRPLPKVPEHQQKESNLQKQESQEDTDNEMEEVDEKLYYVTTSSFPGLSEKEGPLPLSVAIPGQVPAGRVVWHEYVEIDEAEIEKMGGAMPPLPGQLLRLMPLLRNNLQSSASAGPKWRVELGNDDLSDDSDECWIDRSDSLESCPYIEPPQVHSPPTIPDRPDNLDDLIRRKAVASGEYSYAAVPGQNFGLKWMRFRSSNPRHISLSPVTSKDQNQAFILAPQRFAGEDGISSGKQQKADDNQPKSGKSDKGGNQEGFYPPLLPPKSASLLREQKLNSSDRPQSYLIPVIAKKKRGMPANIDKNKSKSTGQLSTASVSRDAATGERMETHKGEATRKKRVPPPKPKPYKVTKQQTDGHPEGMKVMVVDENYAAYDPDKVERPKSSRGIRKAEKNKTSTTRMDLSPSDAINGQLTREKSLSTGSVLETSFSSDFDSREKWIDKETSTQKAAKGSSQGSGKTGKKMVNDPSGQQSREKCEEESEHLRKQSVVHRPFRSDAVKRRHKNSRESPGVESDGQNQAKASENPSLAVLRKNRETIVKHLSRALDMENLDLDFEQGAATSESDKKIPGTGSQNQSGRDLGDILSELDSLLKNNIFSTEDLLQAIQSRLNIKVNIQGDSSQQEVAQGASHDVEESLPSQKFHDTGKELGAESKAKDSEETLTRENFKKLARAEGTGFYVNDEVLLNLKGLKMETYTPAYVNTKYVTEDQSDESAPNSQSSDQSSSSNDPVSSSYENLNKWIDSANKTESHKSDSDTKAQVKSKSPNKKSPKVSTKADVKPTQEGASSLKSKRKVPPQPPIRMRSQSSIDGSPKLRRKKLSNPPPETSELDSPTHGYQLALRMEDERMFTGAHRRANTVTSKDSSSSTEQTASSSPGQSSTSQSSSSGQRPNSGQRLSSNNAPSDSTSTQGDASNDTTNLSPQQSPEHLSVPMSSEQRSPSIVSLVTHPQTDEGESRVTLGSQKIRHHYQNLLGSDDSPPVSLLHSASVRDSRSFSAGSRPFQRVNTARRSTNVDNTMAGGGSMFTNGVGVFTHRGGVLMNAGSGVVIEIPEDAIPRGKKQKLWFEVKQDVINLLHNEGHDSSHVLTDSFQFQMGSTEFENYLAGKRERKVQLGPMILIGPSDAVLTRPIKIKMPHCLPYRNNSWHLHMFARAQNSETQEWTELSNTIGLIDLPPRRTGSKFYQKSSYQMHIDYTQVNYCVINSYMHV